MRLVIGAGKRQFEGWTHQDVQPLDGIDLVCNIRDIRQHVADESCNSIQITHALEHFGRKEVPEVLKDIHAMLKSGGDLYIEVPNFRWHAEILLMENKHEDAEYYAFGGQEDEWDFHKTGFTVRILNKVLEDTGFKNIKITDASSLMAKCIK